MRFVLLAALMVALVMPQPAEAARRDDRPQVSRSAPASTIGRASPRPTPTRAEPARTTAAKPTTGKATLGQSSATRTPNPTAATSRQAALRPGDVRTQRQGVVVRGAAAATLPRGVAPTTRNATRSDARCSRRNGRTICAAPVERPLAWQAGLPVASNAQRDCPAGTLATFARGHTDIVRCMPL